MNLPIIALVVAFSAIASSILVLTNSVSMANIIFPFLACALTSVASVVASKKMVVKN